MADSAKPVDENDASVDISGNSTPPELTWNTFAVRLLRIGYLVTTPSSWSYRNMCNAFWRLYFPHEEGSWLGLAEGRYPLTPRRVHLIPSGVRFDCGTRRDVPQLYVHFDVVGLRETFLETMLGRPIALPPDEPDLIRACEQLTAEFAGNRAPEIMLRLEAHSLVYLALARLMNALAAEEPELVERLVARHDPIAPAIQFIEDHLRDNMSNAELAARCHFSHDHFVRRFKEAIGQTPTRYIQSRRIAVAAQRLLFTRDSIEQIAEQVGFADRFYFSRVFARQMKMGPAAYRKAAGRA
jgi:AraC-like DNA-binding protein